MIFPGLDISNKASATSPALEDLKKSGPNGANGIEIILQPLQKTGIGGVKLNASRASAPAPVAPGRDKERGFQEGFESAWVINGIEALDSTSRSCLFSRQSP